VVVGPNGAGKTTLLLLLNGYLWPASGSVTVLGKQFGKVDLRELRRSVGFVSPHMDGWFSDEEGVLDIVASGASASVRLWKNPAPNELRYAATLVRRVGCGEQIRKRFGQLSQGEKRRITIARAFMAKPLLITFDEPCAGLDVSGREDFLSTLSRIAKGHAQTMVYVTHRIEEIPQGFTHALLLRRGRVVGKGELAQVLTKKNLTHCFGVNIRVRRWRGRFYALLDA
jgi:iron complex transport system ATP-binding protein